MALESGAGRARGLAQRTAFTETVVKAAKPEPSKSFALQHKKVLPALPPIETNVYEVLPCAVRSGSVGAGGVQAATVPPAAGASSPRRGGMRRGLGDAGGGEEASGSAGFRALKSAAVGSPGVCAQSAFTYENRPSNRLFEKDTPEILHLQRCLQMSSGNPPGSEYCRSSAPQRVCPLLGQQTANAQKQVPQSQSRPRARGPMYPQVRVA